VRRSLLALIPALLVTSPALAQQADPAARATAVDLFDAAQALMQQGKFAEACPKLAESYRLDPQLGAILHLGDCLEKAGRFASAYASFREASELAAKRGDPRESTAAERAKALEPKLSRLRIDVVAKVPGLEVLRDGLLLNEASWSAAIPVDPGKHEIEARAPGYESWHTHVDVAGEGTAVSAEIPALNKKPEAAQTGGAATTGGPVVNLQMDDPGSTQRTLGWVTGGVGVVGLGVGLAFTLQKSGKLDSRDSVCPSGMSCQAGDQERIDTLTEEARQAGTLATVSFIAGGVLIAGGAVLIFTAPKARVTQAARSTWVLPVAGRDGFGVFAGHRF